MLEKMMNLVKDQVMNTIDSVPEIPEEKKAAAVETTANSLLDGLKKYAEPENISGLMSMLEAGKSNAKTADAGNNISGNLESNVVSALTSKVGLSSSSAQKIAAAVIPAVLMLLKKNNNESGFNLKSLLESFAGSKPSGGNIMDTLGELFNRKG